MTATILDGKAIAARLRAEIGAEVAALRAAGGPQPGLATVLVGDDPASAVYVRNKHKACAEAGMHSVDIKLPASASQAELLALVAELNTRADVHGILVQLPLPAHIDAPSIIAAIAVHKDVDCLHPENVGLLAQKGRQPRFLPCTPAGVMHILEVSNIALAGANAVVLGRSNIVGMPLSLLLVRADATVTIAHSRTRDLPAVCRGADVLIAAVGVPQMVRADWVKPGATVIDVGINRIVDPAAKSGSRLVGDVAYAEVAERAGAITPVPGGVGPLTIAMLLQNTLRAAQASQ
ncbi:MAG: bifunctional methylenetetrahydrofolate dehydrogenase/methenyltetrahydrofolate cyclohydrolase FolD [Anaerolineales bacterium]|nr:MAG: bifunctional methylenetetrahydrofolate dehydrogenase/methenyltetrahydrofolate cyclohydrolase FolD [Anaerolineales bacterium]